MTIKEKILNINKRINHNLATTLSLLPDYHIPFDLKIHLRNKIIEILNQYLNNDSEKFQTFLDRTQRELFIESDENYNITLCFITGNFAYESFNHVLKEFFLYKSTGSIYDN